MLSELFAACKKLQDLRMSDYYLVKNLAALLCGLQQLRVLHIKNSLSEDTVQSIRKNLPNLQEFGTHGNSCN
jgi:hypothetical protein